MIAITLPPMTVVRLKVMAQARGVLNDRTIIAGSGNLVGFVGEAMFQSFLPTAVPMGSSRDMDFLVYKEGRAFKVDVKTIASDKEPRPHWDCRVNEGAAKAQMCDAYCFATARNDGSGGFLLGWISKSRFLSLARRQSADSLFARQQKHTRNVTYLIVPASALSPMESLR